MTSMELSPFSQFYQFYYSTSTMSFFLHPFIFSVFSSVFDLCTGFILQLITLALLFASLCSLRLIIIIIIIPSRVLLYQWSLNWEYTIQAECSHLLRFFDYSNLIIERINNSI